MSVLIGITAAYLLCRLAPMAGAETLYVSPSGTAGAPGTAAAPLAGVQAALDRARPGDTVHLLAGVYRERVSFKSGGVYGKPVTLEGERGAILDGSETIGKIPWQPAPDVAPGAYRAHVSFPVFTVVAGGKIITTLREDRVAPGKAQHGEEWEWPKLFKNGVGPSGWEGVKALALYFKGKKELLVRFEGDLDPRTLPITLAPKEPIIRISEQNRCVVRGLSLRNAAYGVLIEHSTWSVVENCTIGPVDYGIWLDRGSDRCTVRSNEIFMNSYAGADPHAKGAWDNWQAHKLGGFYDRPGVEIYQSLGGHEVHDNFIHDVWDGVEDRGATGQNSGLRIHHNRIFNISDDGLEPNGAEVDCQWHDNIVERCICGFRIKAPTAGPLYAYRNIFFDNSEDFRNYGEVELKPAIVYIYHNTPTARAAIVSNKVYAIGTPNYHYFNNLFYCAFWWRNDGSTVQPNWKGDYNVFVRRGQDARWESTHQLATQLGIDSHSLWIEGDPGFTDFSAHDVSLKRDSPARHRGADLTQLVGQPLPGFDSLDSADRMPDAGAVRYGAPMPHLPRDSDATGVPPAGSWPGAEVDAKSSAAP